MDLTPKQQASEAIRQAEAILIVTGQRPNIDQVSSVVALSLILRKVGKKVTTLVSDQVPASASFIAQGHIERQLTGLRDFILKVDLSKAEVDKLKYDIEGGKLNIHIMPFKGGFAPSDVTFAHGNFRYDLIIAMGVPQRAKLDRIFEQNAGLLDSTPLLNIDYHRINENFGAINLVDTNAATLSEMLISLAESLETGLIDEEIATAMLTGIIASTDRFTASHTTAKAMTVAAQLMAAGAKQQNIVKALYGSRENRDGKERDSRDRRDRQPDRKPHAEAAPVRREIKPEPAKPADVVTNHDASFVAPILPVQPEPVVADQLPNGSVPPQPSPSNAQTPIVPPTAPFTMPTNLSNQEAMPHPADAGDMPADQATSDNGLEFKPYQV